MTIFPPRQVFLMVLPPAALGVFTKRGALDDRGEHQARQNKIAKASTVFSVMRVMCVRISLVDLPHCFRQFRKFCLPFLHNRWRPFGVGCFVTRQEILTALVNLKFVAD